MMHNRWSRQGVRERIVYALTGSTEVFTGAVDTTHIKAHRSAAVAKGAYHLAIGNSRCWRTTKIHALSDDRGCPVALVLTLGKPPLRRARIKCLRCGKPGAMLPLPLISFMDRREFPSAVEIGWPPRLNDVRHGCAP
jgi:transposase